MKTIVITGASGFIGKAITTHLSEQNFEVIGVSRQPTPNTVSVKNYSQSPEGDFLIHLGEAADIQKAETLGPDYQRSAENTVSTLVKKFGPNILYTSSYTIYGDQFKHAHTELDPTLKNNIYSAIKISNENTVLNGGGCVIRLSNIFGGGMNASTVLTRIISQIDTNTPLTIKTDNTVRDFLYIDDLTSAIAKICYQPANEIYNVGSGEAINIGQLARTCLDIFKQRNRQIYVENPVNHKSIIRIDTSKFCEQFHWTPSQKFSKQLRDYINSIGIQRS